MVARALRQVSVWLDVSAPQQGAFRHALEWASRLSLPLRAYVASEARQRRLMPESWTWEAKGTTHVPPATAELSAHLTQCMEMCELMGVSGEHLLLQGSISQNAEAFLQPDALCVFGNALSEPVK